MNGGNTFAEVFVLARRSLTKTVRRPAQVIPALVFPLFLLAVLLVRPYGLLGRPDPVRV